MYVCMLFLNFEQGVELASEEGVLPRPCYVRKDGWAGLRWERTAAWG